ncbi:hypothetical protein [Xanthomonas sp. XNM01]|uniref:hypothetical protein n=1 Tax=Xanthomonas sp. XNM01 TaxID=2769289 RepID=UPI001780E2F5|nr:hypothetical protein [Xanthomonas sp. XNM01]MBD9367384.1 hypothetical protein [Xanthomonas sp. XNM01]
MRIIRGGLFAIAISLPALSAFAAPSTAAASQERVYFVGHRVSVEGYGGTTLRSFIGLTLDRHRDGSQALLTRVLWGGQSGSGRSVGLLQLDPEDPQLSDYLDVMRSGFRIDIDAKGAISGMAAADQGAWEAVIKDEPRMAKMLMPQDQLLGMRPMALPACLQVGQTIVTSDDSPQFGPVARHAQVRQLDDTHALLDLELKGERISGYGRQVVSRADGMPLEAWLHLEMPEHDDGTPATHTLIYLVDIAVARDPVAMLEDDGLFSREDHVAGLLAEAPFSVPSDDPAMFALEAVADGQLQAWMPDPALLERFDRSAGFVAEQEGDAYRPLLHLGGQLAPKRRYAPESDARPAWQIVRLRGVELLDADGRPIPGLDALPTVRDWTLVDTFGVQEPEAGFPFRLPIGATVAQVEAVERIVLDAQVETYRWDGVEQVDAGAQPKHTDVLLEWGAPHRVTVVIADDADGQAGTWAGVVPYDAAGRQIASTQVDHRPPQVGAGADGTPPVLDWQRRRAPMRLELAAAAPIASVRLQRYRWEWQDRALVFRNAGGVAQGGPLVGSMQIDEPDPRDLPPSPLRGEALLDGLRADGSGYPYWSLRLHAPSELVVWASRLCRVESAAGGRLQGRASIEMRAPGLGYGGAWALEPGAAANERGTWHLLPDDALLADDALPARWPVRAECPASVERVREPVAGSACFAAEGDGWLRLQAACRTRVLQHDDLLIGRDADGVRLASIPADAREDRVRFWGEVAEIDYMLTGERQVQRTIELPQAE